MYKKSISSCTWVWHLWDSSRGVGKKIKKKQVWSDPLLKFLPHFQQFVAAGLLNWRLTHSYQQALKDVSPMKFSGCFWIYLHFCLEQ